MNAHRPGEPWLTAHVLTLVRELRAHGLTWGRATDMIYMAFVLAGHSDVVTSGKIRYLVRRARQEDPDFAPRGAPGRPVVLAEIEQHLLARLATERG